MNDDDLRKFTREPNDTCPKIYDIMWKNAKSDNLQLQFGVKNFELLFSIPLKLSLFDQINFCIYLQSSPNDAKCFRTAKKNLRHKLYKNLKILDSPTSFPLYPGR